MASNDLANSSYEDLLARKETIRSRVAELSSKGNDDVQVLPGSTEVHWDNVMKEMVMQYFGACFASALTLPYVLSLIALACRRLPKRKATTHRKRKEVDQGR